MSGWYPPCDKDSVRWLTPSQRYYKHLCRLENRSLQKLMALPSWGAVQAILPTNISCKFGESQDHPQVSPDGLPKLTGSYCPLWFMDHHTDVLMWQVEVSQERCLGRGPGRSHTHLSYPCGVRTVYTLLSSCVWHYARVLPALRLVWAPRLATCIWVLLCRSGNFPPAPKAYLSLVSMKTELLT